MVNVPIIVTAINAMTISNNARIMANLNRMRQEQMQQLQNSMDDSKHDYIPPQEEVRRAKEEIPPIKTSELLAQKFETSWERQFSRFSSLELKLTDSYEYDTIREYNWTTGRKEYRYANNVVAMVETWDGPDREEELFDEQGNCVKNSKGRYTYYPKTKQIEFSWTSDSFKHFNTSGKEDTERYLAKLQMASKRIEEEKRTGKTFKKMNVVEKVVAKAFRNRKEMTLIEKALAREASHKK